MNKDLNLGMVIGIFFCLTGALLIWYGLSTTTHPGHEINLRCGVVYDVFGFLLLFFSHFSNKRRNNE